MHETPGKIPRTSKKIVWNFASPCQHAKYDCHRFWSQVKIKMGMECQWGHIHQLRREDQRRITKDQSDPWPKPTDLFNNFPTTSPHTPALLVTGLLTNIHWKNTVNHRDEYLCTVTLRKGAFLMGALYVWTIHVWIIESMRSPGRPPALDKAQ
jgi:hypothetical protein